jgi:phenylacetate-CoA ligase
VLERAEFASPAELGRHRRELWAAQRRHVISSPFLAAVWAGTPVPESLDGLSSLPLIDKAMLRLDQAAHPPFGSYLAFEAVARLHRTSGTTGQAMNIALSAADAHVTAVVGGRAQSAAGLGPGHRVVHCLNYQLWMGGVTDHMTLEQTGATVIPFGVGNSRLLVETILEVGATAISCTPSYPSVLERVIAQDFPGVDPADLGLQLGLFGGEPGLDDPEFRARLERTWGFQARNANYGVSDVFCNFASQCHLDTDLHFCAGDVLWAELIDPDTTGTVPLGAGASGELVLTHLERQCQPLVRFRTGDVVVVTATDPCACGRTGFRFRVIGRSDDMVVVRGLNVFPTTVASVINAVPGLSGEYRIVLPGPPPYHRLPVEVEAAEGVEPSTELARRVEEAMHTAVRVTAQVRVVPFGTLPRTEGKTRRVIREDRP